MTPDALEQRIAARIRAGGGWLAFDEFMREALYAPGLGYYSAGSHKIGVGGDFITAPELSSLFADSLATQCAPLVELLGSADILEVGAGTGALACDLLRALAREDRVPDRYRILEVSADLRERQQRSVQELPGELAQRVEWLDEPPQQSWQGVLVANELLDALPFERFVIDAQGDVQGLGVGLDAQSHFIWRAAPATDALREEVRRIAGQLPQPLTPGYASEVCMLVEPWLGSMSDRLTRGALLLCDYGLTRREFYHSQRMHGTLRCHFRHHAHEDPFVHVGLQDITAWVDFTRVAEAADALGLTVAGFATQAAFLLGTGIEARIAAAGDARTRAHLASAARQLLLPGEMGEVFKVMALTRDFDVAPAGFVHQDLRARL